MVVNPANYILLSSKPAGKLASSRLPKGRDAIPLRLHNTCYGWVPERLYCNFNFARRIAFQEVFGLRIFLGGAVEVLIEADSWTTAPIPRLYPGIPFIYTTLYIHHIFTHAVYIIHLHTPCTSYILASAILPKLGLKFNANEIIHLFFLEKKRTTKRIKLSPKVEIW